MDPASNHMIPDRSVNDPSRTTLRFAAFPYHGIMKTDIEPDDKRLYDQFRSGGMDADGAFIAVQEIRTMAGHNIIAKMDAKFA